MHPPLSTVELHPAGAPAASILWLHGLGANGHDFAPVVPHLDLPNVRFVFPNAEPMPVTINGGYVMPAWYDIRTLGPGPDREDAAGIERSAALIRELLDREVARGVPADRVLLAGFSQGGAMALHVARRYPEKLAGVVVLSAYPLLEGRWDADAHPANAATPMFFAHGQRDETVPIERGRRAHALSSADRFATWREYPMGHEVCMEEILHLNAWLKARIG